MIYDEIFDFQIYSEGGDQANFDCWGFRTISPIFDRFGQMKYETFARSSTWP